MVIQAVPVTDLYDNFMEDIKEYDDLDGLHLLEEKEELLCSLMMLAATSPVFQDRGSSLEAMAVSASRDYSEGETEYGPIYDFVYWHVQKRESRYQRLLNEFMVIDNYEDMDFNLVQNDIGFQLELDVDRYTYNLPVLFESDYKEIEKTVDISSEVDLFLIRFEEWSSVNREVGVNISKNSLVSSFMVLIELFLQTSDVDERTVDTWIIEYQQQITGVLFYSGDSISTDYLIRFLKHDSDYTLSLFDRIIRKYSPNVVMHSWGHFNGKSFLALSDKL